MTTGPAIDGPWHARSAHRASNGCTVCPRPMREGPGSTPGVARCHHLARSGLWWQPWMKISRARRLPVTPALKGGGFVMTRRRGIGTHADVAQWQSTSPPSWPRRSDSGHPLHAPLTQLAEYLALNQGVDGFESLAAHASKVRQSQVEHGRVSPISAELARSKRVGLRVRIPPRPLNGVWMTLAKSPGSGPGVPWFDPRYPSFG